MQRLPALRAAGGAIDWGCPSSGLPEAAVKKSKDRVRSALLNSQFEFPLRRITINLAPADLPKEGGRFDWPSRWVAASGQLDAAAWAWSSWASWP
jgi:predicted ATPase with chaperone activity